MRPTAEPPTHSLRLDDDHASNAEQRDTRKAITTFKSFVTLLDDLLPAADSAREATVLEVRALMREALSQPDFRLDVLARAVSLMERPRSSTVGPIDIHVDVARRYTVCLFEFPPRYQNDKHQHQYWTVSGVVHNELIFATYADIATTSQMIKRIPATCGQVGYICSPCVHNVRNETDSGSLSLHIFEIATGMRAESRPRVLTQFEFDGRCITLSEALNKVGTERAATLLDRLARLGSLRAQLASTLYLLGCDVARGRERLDELLAPLEKDDRAKYEEILSAAAQ